MTATLSAMPRGSRGPSGLRNPDRYQLQRAGVLNVWQYDDQVFEFAEGRLLLRGANGAGKSKTLEMLLPFVLDGDKLRMTASGRHHTSLMWLMSDGYDGQSRIGYLWVELARPGEATETDVLTCGIGIRWSSSARQATAWHFTCPRRVGVDLILDDGSGPLSRERCRAEVERDGHFFEQPRAYKEHVGQLLFGLEPGRYDELLRLLYWLRQPQVGEDIEPSRLASQLAQALPELDQSALRAAGDTFDELAHFGTQIERRERAAAGIRTLADVHAAYAVDVVRVRGANLTSALYDLRRRDADIARAQAVLTEIETAFADAETDLSVAEASIAQAAAQRRALEASPEFRSQARLHELGALVDAAKQRAAQAAADRDSATHRADRASSELDAETDGLVAEVARLGGRGEADAAQLGELGVDGRMTVPPALFEPALQERADADRLTSAIVRLAEAAAAASPAIGEALAAVAVVEEARVAARRADRLRVEEERRAAEAESRADDERTRLDEARAAAHASEERLRRGLDAWRADARAVPLELPDDLTGEVVRTIQRLARTAAQPRLDELAAALAESGAQRSAAEAQLRDLRSRRELIVAERDPAPPHPTLGRSPRSDADGAPLWRLVDPVDGLSPQQRAGLEAALESAGLLDAWVRRDGAVLDAEQRDVVIATGPAAGGATLADVLQAAVPDGSVVSAEVVQVVLTRVGLADVIGARDGAELSLDGEWRLGPLQGRASKPVAQYLGATARLAERQRRLDDVDADIASTTETLATAAAAEAATKHAIRDLEAWLAASPPYHELERAWATLEAREGNADRAEAEARRSSEAAASARAVAAARHRDLGELAARHGLPVEEHALAARRSVLVELRSALGSYPAQVAVLRPRLSRWERDADRLDELRREAETRAERAAQQGREADDLSAQHTELLSSVGADVDALRRRLAEVEAESQRAARRRREVDVTIKDLGERRGAARSDLANAIDRQREQQPLVAAAAAAFAEIADVPGLLDSVADRLGETLGDEPTPTTSDDGPGDLRATTAGWRDSARATLRTAAAITGGESVPRAVSRLARATASLPGDGAPDVDAVYRALQVVQAGPGGDLEPRVVPVGALLAVLGRDDAGEHAIGELARRLDAQVIQDRALLTERERRLFEEHVLGGLGDALRERRQEAAELVEAMNALLGEVSTSQGIRVRLQWSLREDVASDARQAVRLLGQPTGALLPDERTTLRDALHRLIDQSRTQAPEESYTEHLSRALDYRQWFAFRIKYSRPEVDGWQDLTRRSALSQGEQKVVCYLPLFAAAAAHFSSLAGAAPYAPRFVLLDDAFPKIDVRTHPLLFGLLVDLDLDFVITSERLWGDHSTVPSLAIYEALRDPHERGIAQYRHVWDGRRLTAIGA